MANVTSSPQTPTATPSLPTPCPRDESLRMFSKLLGAKTSENILKGSSAGVVAPELNSSYKILQKYLVHEPSDPTGGATCSFPSLDLYSGQVAGLPLPNVGKSAKSNPLLQVSGSNSPKSLQPRIPTMTASVFNAQANGGVKRPQEAQAACDAAMLEQAAAQNLGSVTTWTRSTVHLAPLTMLKTLASSFSALVDARVRAWMLLFLRQSLSSGDEQSRSQLMKLLATSQSIDIKSVATSFNALSLPPNVALGQQDGKEGQAKPPTQIILPLLFEVVSNVVLHEEHVIAKLRAPGTLLGIFDSESNSSQMTAVKINLDTKALVASMVEQARLVVFKAVASATSLPFGAPSPQRAPPRAGIPPQQQKPVPRMAASVGATVLAATPEGDNEKEYESGKIEENVRLLPSEGAKPLHRPKSVLKMPSRGLVSSSTLSESESPILNVPRKSRSITWSNSVDVSTQKMGFNPSPSLKSSKSFGRPDANTFSTSRNATFADFGRSVNQAAQHTFMNGKLKVNANAYSMANFTSNGSSSNNENFVLKRNAEFSAASLSLTSNLNNRRLGGGLAGLAKNASAFERAPRGGAGIMPKNFSLGLSKSNTFQKEMENIPQPMLPRTPTALEGLLLQKAQTRLS